eukprot:scaffold44847_cov71-Phaeocystis_antarctica.AAC.3
MRVTTAEELIGASGRALATSKKVDMEASVAVHASALSIEGRNTCSSTACSAFTLPISARFAPSAIARVRTTWCASALVRALCMQWHASSSACSGVGMVCGEVDPHAAGLSTCFASSARPAVAIPTSAAAASSASPHVGTCAKPCPASTKLDGDATDSLLDVLEGGPSGSEGGGESDGVGPPPSLGPLEGRAGWRCDRRRRRGVGRGAARRRADAPSRPGAAPCAPPARPGAVRCAPRAASLVLPPESWLVPSLHSCDAGTTPPCA